MIDVSPRSSTSTRAYPIILSYHGISLWSSMPWPKNLILKWLMCPQGHPHQSGPILYPIILSYHGISLWSSMPWPKNLILKWLRCPQGHPHQSGPILYPILSWHFSMVLNAMMIDVSPRSSTSISLSYVYPNILSSHDISLWSSMPWPII